MADDPTGGGGFSFGGGSSGGFSSSTFANAGGAVTDIFASKGYQLKGQGAEFEKQNYLLAADFATQNEKFTEQSTAIKTMQQEREVNLALGSQYAAVAASGFEQSGSAMDILRDSAAQGALQKAVLQQQGLITEAGYKEQAQSYQNMAAAAQVEIDAEKKAAKGAQLSGAVKGAASGASAGAAFGPYGAIAGGVIGGAAGYFGSK